MLPSPTEPAATTGPDVTVAPPEDDGGLNTGLIIVIALVAVAAIAGGGWFAYSKLIANEPTDQDFDDDEPYEDEYDDDDSPDDSDDGPADELSEPDEPDIVDGEPLPGTAEYERLKYDRTFDTVASDNGDTAPDSRDR